MWLVAIVNLDGGARRVYNGRPPRVYTSPANPFYLPFHFHLSYLYIYICARIHVSRPHTLSAGTRRLLASRSLPIFAATWCDAVEKREGRERNGEGERNYRSNRPSGDRFDPTSIRKTFPSNGEYITFLFLSFFLSRIISEATRGAHARARRH